MRLLFEYLPGMHLASIGGTFARATTATYVDRHGRIRTAASGELRDAHFFNGIRHTLLEEARTQLCTQPQTPASWTDLNTPVLTTAQPDPWGTSVALLVEDNDAGGPEGKLINVTFTGDGTKVVTVAVRPGTAAVTDLSLHDNTAATHRHLIRATWAGGTTPPSLSTISGAGTLFPSVGVYDTSGNLWWLVSFSATSVVAANTNRIIFYPAGSPNANVGTAYFAGANAWNATFPTSWQPSSGHVRNADTLEFDAPSLDAPQAMTSYARYTDLGASLSTNARIWQISGANDNGPRHLVYMPSTSPTLYHQNANGGSSVIASVGAVAYGQDVQFRGLFFATGSVQAGQSINGAGESTGSASGVLAPAAAWGSAGTSKLYIGSTGVPNSHSAIALRSIRFLAGAQSLSTMGAPLSYVRFEDAEGLAYLCNEKPFPGNRFGNWTPDSAPFGDSASTLADGSRVMLRLRDDFGASFEVAHIPQSLVDGYVPVEIAERLRYHLLNGGTCMVVTGDHAGSTYAPCGLRPGAVPQLQLDRRMLEYTLSLQLIHLATTPTRMIARYSEQ